MSEREAVKLGVVGFMRGGMLDCYDTKGNEIACGEGQRRKEKQRELF